MSSKKPETVRQPRVRVCLPDRFRRVYLHKSEISRSKHINLCCILKYDTELIRNIFIGTLPSKIGMAATNYNAELSGTAVGALLGAAVGGSPGAIVGGIVGFIAGKGVGSK